ncbi:RNA polymerase sigma-70 factor [Hymenobacter sp. 5516J-16]|uniref:RNA polymerase sigma-70 factor n=1 Tax=Hymenobacter sublimis TaxID=2933777 RepID=A0ABY4J6G1_9BACT|nr:MULTISPECIES: RNA polymerase sigma-70 factor [Hymenobacter]UOQ77505.1 RNA polymerase sigma-70 factor [Hymenobacter sp. 5516J-16]UPL47487.1 RNA polymerase sigma-70 factor [Hymenobacter sublimis]
MDHPDSELAWLRRLRHDDQRAFDALFQQYSARVYRFAYSYLKARPAAEEIVQDCFLKIWERRHELRDDVPLKGYLFTVAHHAILNQLRQNRYHLAYQDYALLAGYPSTPGTDTDVAFAELEMLYLAALDKLPPKRRRIFTLSRQQGLSYAEIAQELGISVKTVETQMAQALHFLRQYFQAHGTALVVIPLLLVLL